MRQHFLPGTVDAICDWSEATEATLRFHASLPSRSRLKRDRISNLHQATGIEQSTPQRVANPVSGPRSAAASTASDATRHHLQAAFACLQVDEKLPADAPDQPNKLKSATLSLADDDSAHSTLPTEHASHAQYCPVNPLHPLAVARPASTSSASESASCHCVCSASLPLAVSVQINPAFQRLLGWSQGDVDAALEREGFRFLRRWFDTPETWSEFATHECDDWRQSVELAYAAIQEQHNQTEQVRMVDQQQHHPQTQHQRHQRPSQPSTSEFCCTLTTRSGERVRCVQRGQVVREQRSLGGFIHSWTPLPINNGPATA